MVLLRTGVGKGKDGGRSQPRWKPKKNPLSRAERRKKKEKRGKKDDLKRQQNQGKRKLIEGKTKHLHEVRSKTSERGNPDPDVDGPDKTLGEKKSRGIKNSARFWYHPQNNQIPNGTRRKKKLAKIKPRNMRGGKGGTEGKKGKPPRPLPLNSPGRKQNRGEKLPKC